MSNLMLTDIAGWITLIAGAITGIGVIYKTVSKAFHKSLGSAIQPVIDKLEALEKKHDLSDREHAKNYVVRFLADVEQGEKVDQDELHCFWDNYKAYTSLGGNTYVHDKVEKLKKAGKL